MNNKGFAITGILYTLFVLFLLILISCLNGLSSKNNLLQKAIENLDDSFVGYKISDDEIAGISDWKKISAPYTGKYVFSSENGKECYSYLNKGTNMNSIVFTDTECQNQKDSLEIKSIYNFE